MRTRVDRTFSSLTPAPAAPMVEPMSTPPQVPDGSAADGCAEARETVEARCAESHAATAAHEAARQAAKLADEAREIEKANDSAVRLAHFSKGNRRRKTGLFDKFDK